MAAVRKIEVFTAGCPTCGPQVDAIRVATCPLASCCERGIDVDGLRAMGLGVSA